MSELHKALESLRPKDFSDVPTHDLSSFLPSLFLDAELIVNSVPLPPNGSPYDTAHLSRQNPQSATSAADLTVSDVRRPAPAPHLSELQKVWGKPLKLSAKDNALGISVFKAAGHDRHGSWFARTSVHEGLGFEKWKRAMMREFPESLAVQGGPGEGNVRGIGGDKRLEDINVEGIGKMEVYQLSAQFPGPTSPREFITLLLTSENCLSDASKVGNTIPRHYMVVSIPVTHVDAPLRDGFVRGQYESVEMIREIPMARHKHASASTSDLLNHEHHHGRNRGSTIGFAESRGREAKGEQIDRHHDAEAEKNPVEWIMITRSDPGGGIPRFMVERNTPSSIVQDAGKFLDWACKRDDIPAHDEADSVADERPEKNLNVEYDPPRSLSLTEANGILAGVGASIADRPPNSRRTSHLRTHPSTETSEEQASGMIASVASTIKPYLPDSLKPQQRSRSNSNASTSTVSSSDSFASAAQFNTAPEGLPDNDSMVTPSTSSERSVQALDQTESGKSGAISKEMQKIEAKKQQLREKLDQTRERHHKEAQDATLKTAKDLEKATERHDRERKKQEEKFTKEVQKLEARRERETKKLLAKQQKEADKNNLLKIQRERDEWKEKADLAEQEVKILREQIGELQRENTSLVAKMGRTEHGRDILRAVKEEMEGKRKRASSRASDSSRNSGRSGKSEKKHGQGIGHVLEHSNLAYEEDA